MIWQNVAQHVRTQLQWFSRRDSSRKFSTYIALVLSLVLIGESTLVFVKTPVAHAAAIQSSRGKITVKPGGIPVSDCRAPVGWFDSASFTFSGWALQCDGKVADVHFYLNGLPGKGGVLIGYAHADKPRADVVEKYQGYVGNPGFTAAPLVINTGTGLSASGVMTAAAVASSRPKTPQATSANVLGPASLRAGAQVYGFAVSNDGQSYSQLGNSPRTVRLAAASADDSSGTRGCWGNGYAEIGDPGIYIGPDGKVEINSTSVQTTQDPNDKSSVYYIDSNGRRYNFTLTGLGNYDTVSNLPPKSCMKILGDIPPTPDENGNYSEPQKAWLVFRDNKPEAIDEANWKVYRNVKCKCAADTQGKWVIVPTNCSKGQKCYFVIGAGVAKTRAAYEDEKGTHFSINDKCLFNIPTPGELDKDYCVRDNPYDAGGSGE